MLLLFVSLLSLKTDIKRRCQDAGMTIYTFTGDMTDEQRLETLAAVRSGPSTSCLVLTTPEKYSMSSDFLSALQDLHARGKISMSIIDGPHIAQQDLPTYHGRLLKCLSRLRDFRGLCLTATLDKRDCGMRLITSTSRACLMRHPQSDITNAS